MRKLAQRELQPLFKLTQLCSRMLDRSPAFLFAVLPPEHIFPLLKIGPAIGPLCSCCSKQCFHVHAIFVDEWDGREMRSCFLFTVGLLARFSSGFVFSPTGESGLDFVEFFCVVRAAWQTERRLFVQRSESSYHPHVFECRSSLTIPCNWSVTPSVFDQKVLTAFLLVLSHDCVCDVCTIYICDVFQQ